MADKIIQHRCPCHGISRREFLAMSVALTGGLLLPGTALAGNIQDMHGTVFVNRSLAMPTTMISPGDLVTVAHGGHLAFTIGDDAYLLRGGTSMRIEAGQNMLVTGLRLLTGAFLGVFGRHRKTIYTRTAVIGIRGTGLYLDTSPVKTYFCTCYGETELQVGDTRETITAEHHHSTMIYTPFDAPPRIVGMAGFIDHTDDELRQSEAYVGRTVPFG